MLSIETVVSYTNDGTVNTGFVSEQTEPLGEILAGKKAKPGEGSNIISDNAAKNCGAAVGERAIP